MEPGRSIRKRLVVNFQILVFLISLMQGTSAMSANPQQSNWDVCMHEEFSENLCNPGQVRNTKQTSCSELKHCCACPRGSFMDGYNNCTQCKPQRDCMAEGKEVQFEGNTTADATCGDDIPRTTTVVSAIMPTTPSPTVEGSNSSIEPNLTKDELSTSSTTSNPTGDDDGKRGNSVRKCGGGCTAVIIIFGILLVIALVTCLFKCCRSKKKPPTTSDVDSINSSDQEGSNKKTTEV